MSGSRAVVIGAGIGGLAAAAGLHAAGWDVTVCERAASLEPVGLGLGLAPNGLRALDTIDAGEAIRALAVPQEPTAVVWPCSVTRPTRMTPNLGQGACQALEDATVIARLAVALRNTTLLLAGKLMPNASLRAVDRIYAWQP